MDDEEGLLGAIAEAPGDLAPHLIYADWLEERGAATEATCLRAWADLVATPYDDATFRALRAGVEAYQAQVRAADPDWVWGIATIRDWVDAGLAERLARLHLRVRHGRPADRQWVVAPRGPLAPDAAGWQVTYWRQPPDRPAARRFRDTSWVLVDRVTGEVDEPC